ncbi:MAG: hypothetical protein ABJN75_18960 [Hoeflea sp.]|uniref:hypothetical protein n=1 Tax=Hoeflea sp. TaxID=1940281 RepID=UPI003298FADC
MLVLWRVRSLTAPHDREIQQVAHDVHTTVLPGILLGASGCSVCHRTLRQSSYGSPIDHWALNVAAKTSAIELMRLKMDRSPALRIVEKAEYILRSDLQTCFGVSNLTDPEAFGHGYRSWFDRALELMTDDARRMNNPGARLAIFEAIMRLEKIRFDIASDKGGKVRTLSARNYMM